jgi:hypothetical protein
MTSIESNTLLPFQNDASYEVLAEEFDDWAQDPDTAPEQLPFLLAWLEEIAREVKGDYESYLKHREAYVLVHRWLNQKRLIAPAFRPLVTAPGRQSSMTGAKEGHQAILLDRQLIDLHWLSCTGTAIADASLGAALATWDADVAITYARKPHRAKSKTMEMGLLREKQYELIVLHVETIHDKRRNLIECRNQLRAMLKQKQNYPGVYQKIQKPGRLADIWLAREVSLLVQDSPRAVIQPEAVRHWYKLITGRTLTWQQVKRHLASLDRFVDGKKELPALKVCGSHWQSGPERAERDTRNEKLEAALEYKEAEKRRKTDEDMTPEEIERALNE